ncbi:hypothetical protein [Nodosilinea sp. P-1105]|nr:hypothetical protein [Nodosilinea sp. P-1105]
MTRKSYGPIFCPYAISTSPSLPRELRRSLRDLAIALTLTA